ncbi:DUF3748 domain-containing protein [Agriterribacter sp.]|uniref:DUF3748 domain-containing protein n=1 Tax=Agriterribacter sp. TaxID=2821509 RepID=UPI002D103284|nr:DUF3748 domain-containing protein [Agriterribacter sp.]HTN08598.1 DUF3748 domain-containing protein [Agriterribacter sp.]
MRFTEKQLTHDPQGHFLNSTQVFSPDDEWIVYDTRNDDGGIGVTGSIEMANVPTGKIQPLYHTQNQTKYGPGVGAATFSPTNPTVLFIHGIRNANEAHPYGFTRRTGVAIHTTKPFEPVFMDARNITPPFTPGALRGGTHAHSWSGDGQWISFTYNDYIMEQLSKTDTAVKDLRTIAVMMPGTVTVPDDGAMENNNGAYFSAIVAKVTEKPEPGSNEIDKAFDECWIGSKGYQKADGSWQHRAVAFQGNVRNEKNETIAEVFVTDIPDDITKASPGDHLEGTARTRPDLPAGVVQRRITHTPEGIQGPRHWLRTTPDGSLILFMAKDPKGIIQVYGVSPNGGSISQVTFNDFSIQGPINISPDGSYVSYIADNSVFITGIQTHLAERLTPRGTDEDVPFGAAIWSNDGRILAFNRRVKKEEKKYVQIFLLRKQ